MLSDKALILDDHKMFAESFAELLKKISAIGYTDQVNSVRAAKVKLAQDNYAILFSDVYLPGEDVKELIAFCKTVTPEIKIIILSSCCDAVTVKELMGAGIDAYVSKGVGSYEVQLAIDKVFNGEKYLSTDIAAKIASIAFVESRTNLTKKEMEVLRLVAHGHTIAEIADILHLSTHTIVTHRRNIMQKLNIRSATEMVRFAYENNLY